MKPYYEHARIQIYRGDCREVLPALPGPVHCCVTSPPYWGLRDYGVASQLGLERTPDEYIAAMVGVFREVKRVLRDDGTLWLNMGDSYQGGNRGEYGKTRGGNGIQQTNPGSDTIGAPNRFPIPGLKPKDLIGIPWMLAFALRADGWYLRSDIIWSKPNPMPESVTDRPTKAHEYIFLLSKSERYYYNAEAIKEASTEFNWESRLERKSEKSVPTEERSGIRTRGPDKQRGHGRRHAGFNDRWDMMEKSEQCSGMRNKRDVWEVSPQAFPEAHFATFPEELIKPCILAGCPEDGTVLDPFMGSGTTALIAQNLQCNAVGIELNPAYIEIAKRRLSQEVLEFQP